MLKRFLLAAAALAAFLPAIAHAQYQPMVTKEGGNFQAGFGVTTANADINYKRIDGIAFYGTYDLPFRNLSVAADLHFNTIITPNDYSQSSYEAGIRYTYPVKNRYLPYAKVEAGIGNYNFNQVNYGIIYKDSFSLYTIGGGLDIKLSHHINIRAIDYEYQTYSGFPPHGLHPTELTFGAAYRFH